MFWKANETAGRNKKTNARRSGLPSLALRVSEQWEARKFWQMRALSPPPKPRTRRKACKRKSLGRIGRLTSSCTNSTA